MFHCKKSISFFVNRFTGFVISKLFLKTGEIIQLHLLKKNVLWLSILEDFCPC